MNTSGLDVVIPLKPADENEELHYTLRAIAENLACRKVFLAGYQPTWTRNVEYIGVPAASGAKYASSSANVRAACLDPRVTNDFILMADDIFVVKPCDFLPVLHRGSIDKLAATIDALGTAYRSHADGIRRIKRILADQGVTGSINNYELHIPMIFNKQRRLAMYELQDKYPAASLPLFTNTLYGNYFAIGGQETGDVKILQPADDPLQTHPDATFLSSSDLSFATGRIGAHIRKLFPHPSIFEI